MQPEVMSPMKNAAGIPQRSSPPAGRQRLQSHTTSFSPGLGARQAQGRSPPSGRAASVLLLRLTKRQKQEGENRSFDNLKRLEGRTPAMVSIGPLPTDRRQVFGVVPIEGGRQDE